MLEPVPKYEVRCRDGNIVGLCNDYDGFVLCVKHVSPLQDLSFPHNEEKTDFCAKDAYGTVMYYPVVKNP